MEFWIDDGIASKTFTEKEFFIIGYINKINIFSLFKIRMKKHSEEKLTIFMVINVFIPS